MRTEADYRSLLAECAVNGMRIDECVDRENVLDATGISELDADFWDRMYRSARMQANQHEDDVGDESHHHYLNGGDLG